MRCLEIFVLTTLVSSLFCDVHDYYWRKYNGEIPVDAVPGGLDINNKTIYIGHAYYIHGGIIPALIYPGKVSVSVVLHGKVYEEKQFIEILCSMSLGKLKWIPATVTDFHLQMINKFPVKGGIQFGDYSLYIGRVWDKGELKVGYIFGAIDDEMLYVADKSTYVKFSSYETLVYEILPYEERFLD